ncbi:MAG TPA: nuclear transport factor 2 family protein [Acidimicrobiales bacterium]|nr:nuclear transport factor 2 family protein [Acidimicrobiales bacterium]
MTRDSFLRKLCNDFFDALERGDVAAVAEFYAPGMTMWVNTTGDTMTREENLAVLEQGKGLLRRRLYNDRTINTFDDGFVVQYTCHVVAKNGTQIPLSSCLVAEVHDDKINKLYEYMDTGRLARA